MQTFHEQLIRIGAEVIKTVPVNTKKITIPKATDLVIVNGEGSLHRGQHRQLVDIANDYPAILVNSVWQDNPNYSALRKFRYVAVRESFSLKELPHNIRAEVIPDLSFASSALLNFQKGQPTKDVGVTDNVTQKNQRSGITALQPVETFLTEITQYRRLCIGRFHAATTAAVLGIPFSVWPSNTHKMIGMLTDMGVPHLHCATKKQALDNVPEELDSRIEQYATTAREQIYHMFDNIPNLL